MSAAFTPTRYKLSVDDYHKLGDAGILHEDSRVELIEGELIEMAPIGASHMHVVNRLTKLMVFAVGDLAMVSIQNPVTLPRYSEPQPDIAILEPAGDAKPAVPRAKNVMLVIEVSDTTLAYDRGTKLRLYAREGIGEAWIANVQAQCVEVYRMPTADGYAQKRDYGLEETVSPLALPQVRLAVREIFR
jgi:Uma2 family endonuclease